MLICECSRLLIHLNVLCVVAHELQVTLLRVHMHTKQLVLSVEQIRLSVYSLLVCTVNNTNERTHHGEVLQHNIELQKHLRVHIFCLKNSIFFSEAEMACRQYHKLQTNVP